MEERLKRHNEGHGSEYAKRRRPVQFLYFEEYEDKKKAEERERQIKRLGIRNKERLIMFGPGRRFPSAQSVGQGRLGTLSLVT